MSEAFVMDASVACAWVLPSQGSPGADALLAHIEAGAIVVVPSSWFLDVANGLLVAQRRKLITASERRQALQRLLVLTVTIDEDAGRAAFGQTSELAEQYGLSVYDAAYLEIGLRRRLPLGTRDKALRAAARRSGLSVLG